MTTSPAPLSADVAGMIVYNTANINDVTAGFYYNDGAIWVRIGAGVASDDWSLTGNAATTPGTNYVGTSDNQDLYISRQGSDQIRLTASELVINENSDDRNLRVESDNNASLFVVDAGTDRVMVNPLLGAFGATNFQSRTDNANIALIGSSYGAGRAGYFHTDATSTAAAGLSSFVNNGGIAMYADNDAVANGNDTFVARSDSEEGFGAGWFVNVNDDDASGYGTAEASVGILSEVTGAGEYHIGVYGKSESDKHSMGVYGNITTPGGTGFTTHGAGALGYRNGDNGAGGTVYGGFFEGDDGGATDGTFRTSSNTIKTQSSVGFAAKGGLMGGWTKGSVYGLATQGERFSLYVNGREFTNDVITQLNNSNNSNRIATYVPTSTTVDVTSKGVSKLNNGRKRVAFNKNFSQLSSTKEPIIVTVTPLGKSNGVYIESVDDNGFTIVENNDGKANVQFTWIAIATRKGSEKIETPEELLANDYDYKLSKFMTGNIVNNNKTEGQEMWWDGNKTQYNNTPEPKFNPANSVKGKDKKEKNIPLKMD